MVCAELPDPATHPQLYATVTGCMLHGPCGPNFKDCPCMGDGRCKYRYPRAFQEETSVGLDSYPAYCRSRNGQHHRHNGFDFNNRWVVPYNPFLTNKYDCHINVKSATAIGAVKYLFKYAYKGNDWGSFVVQEDSQVIDETQDYLDARYISPAEACYRLFCILSASILPRSPDYLCTCREKRRSCSAPQWKPGQCYGRSRPQSLRDSFSTVRHTLSNAHSFHIRIALPV